ncbi:MAG: IclR family transcriptional regulator [Pseudomonadota bacterium]
MPENRVEAVERALTILESFSEPGEEVSLGELSKRTGFYKSTLLRLLGSLQHFGYVVRQPNGAYRLGPSLWRLGSLYRREFLPAETVRPILRELQALSGETASFYVRDGNERVCLYRINSSKPIRHHLEEGVRLPLRRGAAGKLISAYTDANDPEFAEIRDRGVAISRGERDPEIAAIAVPLFTSGGRFAGALALSGLVAHFDADASQKYVAAMKEAARTHASAL